MHHGQSANLCGAAWTVVAVQPFHLGRLDKLFVFGPAGTAQYFANVHIPMPDIAAWIVIIIELLGGILILVGFQTRWVALVLAILPCHRVRLSSAGQATMHDMIHFYKNLAMAGGFLYVFAFGAGMWSVDARKA